MSNIISYVLLAICVILLAFLLLNIIKLISVLQNGEYYGTKKDLYLPCMAW